MLGLWKQLLWRPFAFFLTEVDHRIFWNRVGTVLFVKMNRIRVPTRLLPSPACRLRSSCGGGWCCIPRWESGRETFEAGRIGQRAAVCVSGCRERHDEDYMWILSCYNAEESTRRHSHPTSAVGQCGPGPGILLVSLDSGTGQVIDLSSS